MKILYIITNLSTGGAEIQLVSLIKELKNNNEIVVISLISRGEIGSKLDELGIPLHVLDLYNFFDLFKSVLSTREVIRQFKPDLIHTWMYHSNLIGGIISYFMGFKRIIWSIHHNNFSFKHNNFYTVLLIRISALFSYFIPKKIVCVSKDVLINHKNIFYNYNKLCYVPNGVNPEEFPFELKKNFHLVDEFDIKPETILIGFISRFDPIKNHYEFLRAINIIKSKNLFDFKIILCGKNIDKNNTELMLMLQKNNLLQDVVLLGLYKNMQLLYRSLDLVVCTSFSESFSIVLAEAILCGKLCVSTISGDPELLLSNSQHIYNAYDPNEIADVITNNLNLKLDNKQNLVEDLRFKLLNKYTISKVSEEYLKLYKELI